MRLEYHPTTVSDLNGAISHYNAVQEGLRDALRTEVHAAIDRILEHPQQYAETGGVRRALVRRFPYFGALPACGGRLHSHSGHSPSQETPGPWNGASIDAMAITGINSEDRLVQAAIKVSVRCVHPSHQPNVKA